MSGDRKSFSLKEFLHVGKWRVPAHVFLNKIDNRANRIPVRNIWGGSMDWDGAVEDLYMTKIKQLRGTSKDITRKPEILMVVYQYNFEIWSAGSREQT